MQPNPTIDVQNFQTGPYGQNAPDFAINAYSIAHFNHIISLLSHSLPTISLRPIKLLVEQVQKQVDVELQVPFK
jgi:hypothetical protein